MIGLLLLALVLDTPALAADARQCAPAVEALAEEHVGGLDLAARAWTCGRVARAARAQGVSVPLALAVAWHESRLEHGARSHRGAVGPMQVVPRWWCPTRKAEGCDLVAAGVLALRTYLAQQGRVNEALCAYNAGNQCGARGRAYALAVLARERRWGG